MKKPNLLLVAAFFAAIPLTPLLAQPSLTDGLVAYYPFNGNANDESGNGYTGTPDGVTLTSDRFGEAEKAYFFDGDGDHVRVEPAPNFWSTGNLTFSCWIKIQPGGQFQPRILHNGTLDVALNGTSGSPKVAFAGRGFNGLGYSMNLSSEVNYHVAGSYDGTTAKLYLDGIEVASTNVIWNFQTTSLPLGIGRNLETGTDKFAGVIDDVRIYDRALSDVEIWELYSLKPTLSEGLIAHYPLDGSSNDASGNGNDAISTDTSDDVNRFGLESRSFAFNGNTSELTTPPSLLNLGQAEYTIKIWFKLNNAALQYQSLVYTPDRSPGIGISYNDPTVPNKINWAIGPGGTVPGWTVSYLSGSKSDYQSGQWYQLVFVKSGADYKMYIDGLFESGANVPNSFDFETGLDFGFLTSSTSYLNGNMDDISVYSRALSASEIEELYLFETGPGIDISRAVKLIQYGLEVGVEYQLQQSTDLAEPLNWIDYGDPFTATDITETLYADVADWNSFWRLVRVSP